MSHRRRTVDTPFSSRNLRNLEKTGITVKQLVGKPVKIKDRINVRRLN